MLDPERIFREAIRQAADRAGLQPERIPLTYPPKPELGDLATPVCFELARAARKPPRALAEAIVEAWQPSPGLDRLEVAGAGFINGFLDRQRFLADCLGTDPGRLPEPDGPKSIVEHTNINPNKAAHIGHLRNAVLGDTLVRCLRRLGRRVEVQNYIDDTGVQVADLVVGFSVLRDESLDEVRERYDEQALRERGERFDYIAWDLYAEVTRFYQEDESRRAHQERTLKLMEEGGNPTADLAAHVAGRMVRHHLGTMLRIGVRYDLLPRESDILGLHFWETAFERLKESGAIELAEKGRHAGCWIMRMPGVEEGAGEDAKVIVRSSGIVTYVGKDIAYQLWKFGLLGRDFRYERFDWAPEDAHYELWSTTTTEGAAEAPGFGGGQTVYNVIDTRQKHPQQVVVQALRSLGHDAEADRSIHYAYDMVALTPAAVATLFPDYPMSDEERSKPHIEMSGRRGLGVRADDLLDTLVDRARQEVTQRNAEMDPAEVQRTAEAISVGALRYYMLRFSRNTVVAFDFEAALAFQGETGPYLQYSVVRARNILATIEQRDGAGSTDAATLAGKARFADLDPEAATDHWSLIQQLLRVGPVVEQSVESELSTLAKHAYVLAQSFNSFYHRYPVAQETDAAVRATRIAIVRLYFDGMVALLRLMGIEVPRRM